MLRRLDIILSAHVSNLRLLHEPMMIVLQDQNM
jgi:hypothetical protein